jgi:hypothetical protein
MNKIDDLMYEAGLTAQGCWDEMDEYNRTAIMKFAELIVRECAKRVDYWESRQGEHCDDLLKHFGVIK